MFASSSSQMVDTTGFTLILEQIKNSPVSGRVVTEFDMAVLASNPELRTELDDGDKVTIPYYNGQVYVYGEVQNNGASKYVPNKDISYYIDSVGGFSRYADETQIFVVNPDGSSRSLNIRRGLLSTNNDEIRIYPGSVIFVPKQLSYVSGTEIASIWGPIVSSFAVTLTSLSVLNNNK